MNALAPCLLEKCGTCHLPSLITLESRSVLKTRCLRLCVAAAARTRFMACLYSRSSVTSAPSDKSVGPWNAVFANMCVQLWNAAHMLAKSSTLQYTTEMLGLVLNAFAAAESGDEVRARMFQFEVEGELVRAAITEAPWVPRAPTTATMGCLSFVSPSMSRY